MRLVDHGPALVCRRCQKSALPGDFPRSANRPTGRFPYCSPCARERKREDYWKDPVKKREQTLASHRRHREARLAAMSARYRADPDAYHEATRAAYLMRVYGITVDQFNDLVDAQAGLCGICGRGETDVDPRTGKTRKLAVDHCHDTGEIRGLLCRKCNTALGLLGDDLAAVEAVFAYLDRER